MAVHGSTRRPAAKGDRPWTVWRNWVRKKIDAEHSEAEEHGGHVDGGEAAVAKQSDVQHGVVRPELPGEEGAQRRRHR